MSLLHTEVVCERDCGYEAAVGGFGRAAFERTNPDECPRCGGALISGGERA